MKQLKCSTCGLSKNTGEFSVDNYSKRRGGTKRGYTYSCLECLRKYRKKRMLNNPKPFVRRNAKRREQYKDPKERQRQRNAMMKSRYGLTGRQYNALLKKQGGVCAICGNKSNHKTQKYLHIDHNHSTGIVRGLLCIRCNTVIGSCKESIEILNKAAKYLYHRHLDSV